MSLEEELKPKRRWQNLLHKKCPNCNSRLTDDGKYLKCPTPHQTDEGRNCFFVKITKAAEMLQDPDHPANFCLSAHERQDLESRLREEGFVK